MDLPNLMIEGLTEATISSAETEPSAVFSVLIADIKSLGPREFQSDWRPETAGVQRQHGPEKYSLKSILHAWLR